MLYQGSTVYFSNNLDIQYTVVNVVVVRYVLQDNLVFYDTALLFPNDVPKNYTLQMLATTR